MHILYDSTSTMPSNKHRILQVTPVTKVGFTQSVLADYVILVVTTDNMSKHCVDWAYKHPFIPCLVVQVSIARRNAISLIWNAAIDIARTYFRNLANCYLLLADDESIDNTALRNEVLPLSLNAQVLLAVNSQVQARLFGFGVRIKYDGYVEPKLVASSDNAYRAYSSYIRQEQRVQNTRTNIYTLKQEVLDSARTSIPSDWLARTPEALNISQSTLAARLVNTSTLELLMQSYYNIGEYERCNILAQECISREQSCKSRLYCARTSRCMYDVLHHYALSNSKNEMRAVVHKNHYYMLANIIAYSINTYSSSF